MQHQLTERRQYRRGMGGQPQQPQRHRRAAFDTVFQCGVHQPFVGKGQSMLHGAFGRCGGRILTVPQFQQMHAMARRQQLGGQTASQQCVGTGGILHPITDP